MTGGEAYMTEYGVWSPDGKSLAFLSGTEGLGGSYLMVQSLNGDVVKQFLVPMVRALNLQWVSGGMFVVGEDLEGRQGMFRADLASEKIERVMPFDDAFFTKVVAPDGKTIYHRRPGGSGRAGALIAYDISTSTNRDVATVTGGGRFSVSPDGRMFAYQETRDGKHAIYVRPIAGGEPRLIYRPAGRAGGNRGSFPFTPDGRYILWAERREDRPDVDVWRIAVDGSGATPIAGLREVRNPSRVERVADLTVSPDGRRIAFGAGENRGEIWRIIGVKGFAPARASK